MYKVSEIIQECTQKGITDFKVIGTELLSVAKNLDSKINTLAAELAKYRGYLSEIKKFLEENPAFSQTPISRKKTFAAVIDSDLFETNETVQFIAYKICNLIKDNPLLPRSILDLVKAELDSHFLMQDDIDTTIFATIKYLCDKEVLGRNDKLVVKGPKWEEKK